MDCVFSRRGSGATQGGGKVWDPLERHPKGDWILEKPRCCAKAIRKNLQEIKRKGTLLRECPIFCVPYSSCWPYLALQPTYFPLFSRLSGQGSASSITQLRPIFLAVSKRPAAAIFLTVAGCFPRCSAYSTRLISNFLPPQCKR